MQTLLITGPVNRQAHKIGLIPSVHVQTGLLLKFLAR